MAAIDIILVLAVLAVIAFFAKKYFSKDEEEETHIVKAGPVHEDIKFKTSKANVIVTEEKSKLKSKQNGIEREMLVAKDQIIGILSPTGEGGHCPNCNEIISNEASSCPFCKAIIVDEMPEILAIDDINEE